MRGQEQRHEHGHDEVGGTQLARLEPNLIALIEGVEQIRAPPEVEHPNQGYSQPALQHCQRQQSQHCGNEIAVGSGNAQAAGKSGETTPGTRNDKPTKRKQCSRMSGCMASARGCRRSSGKTYRAKTMPHAMKLNAMLIPNKASGGM